jgi:tetratricopeptide (TPR) repeat protein
MSLETRPLTRSRWPALACVLVLGFARPAAAQPIGDALTDADALYFAGKVTDAYALLTEHLEASPTDYEALWRASRAGVVAGVLENRSIAHQNEYLDPAILLGDRAMAVRPDGIDGLYWRGAALGRRALNAGPRYSADLAQRVYDDAHAILALDSLHAGAHNLLGRINYEIMDLPRIARFMARQALSHRALHEASWEKAEQYLRRAAELAPDHVLYNLDLGDVYQRRGYDEEAREVLRRVTTMPSVHPADDYFKETAQHHLEDLGS